MTTSALHQSLIQRFAVLLLTAGASIAVARLLMSVVFGYNIYDEGLVVFNAQRIVEGDLPYRDFWTIYAPGQFYWLAMLFKVFGSVLTVERINGAIFTLATVALLGNISFRLSANTRAGLISAGAMLIATNMLNGLASPVIMAMFCSALCTWLLLREDRNHAVLAGLALIAATAFRHDLGAYSMIGHSLALILCGRARTTLIPLAVTYALGLVVLISWLGVHVGWQSLTSNLLEFPSREFAQQRRLPWPKPLPKYWSIYVAPLLLVLFALRFRHFSRAHLIPAAVSLMMLAQVMVRSDQEHSYPGLMYALVLVGPIVLRRENYPKPLIVILVLVCTVTGWRRGESDLELIRTWQTGDCALLNSGRGGFNRDCGEAPGLAQALSYMTQHSQPRDTIFVGNAPHDRAYINDALFYFLSERKSASRFHELHPGVSNTAKVQQEIIEHWNRQPPDWIVLRTLTSSEPNGSSSSSGVSLLDDFIASHFEIIERAGEYTILRHMPTTVVRIERSAPLKL